MMRSMFAGVSGLKNHQIRMDVVGNNIANINTTGFKASRVTFQDMLSQTLRGGTAPVPGGAGGINPAQVGLGMLIGTIDTLHTQGNLSATGKSTDMAIQGEGFFVLSNGEVTAYSRDGAFDIAQDGDLVNPANGYRVQGWMADANGVVDSTKPVESINIPIGQRMIAQATTIVTLTGNINAVATTGTQGTITESEEIKSDTAGTPATAATALTSLYNAAGTSLGLQAGDIITVSAYKGGSALTDKTGVVGVDFTTYGELMEFVEDVYGITSDATGVVATATGAMQINGDIGEGNALTQISITATDSTGATARTVFNSAMNFTETQAANGTSVTSSMTVYDSQGVSHAIRLIFTRTGSNTWSWTADCDDDTSGGRCVTNDGAMKTLVFDANGAYSSHTGTIAVDLDDANNLAITLSMSNLTQFSGDSTVSVSEQNGYPMGTLEKFSIGSTGEITGIYTNGLTEAIGQIALARFANPGGLLKDGNNLFKQSTNSGVAQIGIPGSGGRGTINNGVLEMSNVDLAQTFTDMIVTQRGFQANARIITSSDDMLQELVNLKR